MPELPEVETVRRSLEWHLLGRVLTAVSGAPLKMRRPLDPTALATALAGRRVRGARRRGKYLLVDLSPPGSLLVHLGMTGRLMVCDAHGTPAPHTHLRISLDDGRELRFVDPRRFGFMSWLAAGAEAHDPSLARLGMDALDPQLPLRLPPLLRRRRGPVKALLLDQSLVAGVGNIYAAEALWRAGIRPTRSGARTAERRLGELARRLQEVLGEAIAEGGTTLRDFATPDGGPGYFSISLNVYGRVGQSCPRCHRPLRGAQLGGRSTVWCDACQR